MSQKRKFHRAAIGCLVIVAAIPASCRRADPAGAPTERNGAQADEPATRSSDEAPNQSGGDVGRSDAPARSVASVTAHGGGNISADPPRRHETVTADGTYSIAFETSPDPIPLNRLFSMEVEVRDAGDPGKPLADIILAADAAMPHHEHGMNTQPKVRQTAEGRFTVTGMQFHMPGYWEIYFDVTRGGLTERAYVAFEL